MSRVTDPLADAITRMDQAFRAAVEVIRGVPDDGDAFRASTRLADLLAQQAEALAAERVGIAAGVWRAEALSLAGLARRISVSKTRADQLVRAARTDRPRETHDG